jgi:hypothetical protein
MNLFYTKIKIVDFMFTGKYILCKKNAVLKQQNNQKPKQIFENVKPDVFLEKENVANFINYSVIIFSITELVSTLIMLTIIWPSV